MATQVPASSDESVKIANDSGFPLQIAIQHAVETAHKQHHHGWRVAHIEHAWQQPDDSGGFIDLVIRDGHGVVNLVVECKRQRDSAWVFMATSGQASNRRHAKAWVTFNGVQGERVCEWAEVPVDPMSPEAHFCAVSGQAPNERNALLERAAAQVVLATESLAHHERDFWDERHDSIRLYYNVVVTNARLKVVNFDPASISLTDGTIGTIRDVQEVPYLRFRKQFSWRQPVLTVADWHSRADTDYLQQNTVFVVHANSLMSFLADFEVPNDSFRPYQR